MEVPANLLAAQARVQVHTVVDQLIVVPEMVPSLSPVIIASQNLHLLAISVAPVEAMEVANQLLQPSTLHQ
jgi:hypothetical protein